MKLRIVLLLLFIPLVTGTAVGGYLGIVKGTPSIAELKKQTVPGTRVYADDNTLLAELSAQKSIHVPVRQIPESLINAVVAVEDSRFFKHKGVDYIAIMRAAVKDVIHQEFRQGGSTITQQLAKITFLSPEKTIKRKMREAALALKIEKSLSKEEILELYLNRIYLGHGAYGVQMAANVYFGKHVKDLTLPEAALIAGLIKAPVTYSPFNNAARAKERQAIVLQRMWDEGYITRDQMNRAREMPIRLSARRPVSESYQYFIDYVKKYLEKRYGPEKVYSGELRVYTTLQKDLQAEAQRVLKEGLRDVDKRRGWRGPLRRVEDLDEIKTGGKAALLQAASQEISEAVVLTVAAEKATLDVAGRQGTLLKDDALWAQKKLGKNGKVEYMQDFSLKKILKPGDVVLVRIKSSSAKGLALSLEQEPECEGALAAIDPHTGFIRALVGGYDYRRSEFNRALYAKRQAGSAFKPIIYAAAIDMGYTPSEVIMDEPLSFEWSEGKWDPKNYDGEYWGPISLRKALAFSRNVVTIKLLHEIGIDTAIGFAQRMGVNAFMPRNLTLALGSLSITPLEMVSTYAPFANGGTRITPVGVKYITDSRGRVLESNEPPGINVISPETAFLMNSMLQDVVSYGTGRRARALSGKVAGKTGTTNDYRDAWFIGFSRDLLAGVWVGFDDMRPMGPGQTGSVAASPVWTNFMKFVQAKYPAEDFGPPPDTIITYTVDAETGELIMDGTGFPPETTYKEYFRVGTEPLSEKPLQPIQQDNAQIEQLD